MQVGGGVGVDGGPAGVLLVVGGGEGVLGRHGYMVKGRRWRVDGGMLDRSRERRMVLFICVCTASSMAWQVRTRSFSPWNRS